MRFSSILAKSCAITLTIAGMLVVGCATPAIADEMATPVLNAVSPPPASTLGTPTAGASTTSPTTSGATTTITSGETDASSFTDNHCSQIGEIATSTMVTKSACVLAPGKQMLELGFTREQLKISALGTTNTITSLPEALVRIGTPVKNLEAQASAPDYVRWDGTAPGASGSRSAISPISVGARYLLSSNARFTQSVQATLGLGSITDGVSNVGSPQYYAARDGALGYGLDLSYEAAYRINSKFTAVGSIGDYGTYEGFAPSLGVKAQLPSELTGFAEFQPFSEGAQFGLGLSRPFGNNILVHGEYRHIVWNNNYLNGNVSTNTINLGVALMR